MRAHGALSAFFALILCAPASFAAAPGIWFEVERAPGAEACPDAAALTGSMSALFDPSVARPAASQDEAALSVKILIQRAEKGFQASLRVDNERSSERRFADEDPSCRGLPDALAVAVVLLIEPRAERRRVTTRAHAPEPRDERRPDLIVDAEAGGLGGSGALGEFGGASLGGFVGVSASYGGPGLRLRGARQLALPTTVGAGQVELDLWAAFFGPCYRFELPNRFALLPCVDVGLGQQRGVADGFPVQREDSAPWRVIAPDVTLLAPLGGRVSAMISASAVFALHRQDYLIDDKPVTSQPKAGLLLALGLAATFGPEHVQ